MKITKYISLGLFIICIAYSWYASLQSGGESSGFSSEITRVFIDIISKVFKNANDHFDAIHSVIRKLFGHFGFFVIMSIFGFYSFNINKARLNKNLLITLSLGIVIAVISELLQLLPEGRGCSIIDVGIDYSGYILGTAICFLITKKIIKKKEKLVV